MKFLWRHKVVLFLILAVVLSVALTLMSAFMGGEAAPANNLMGMMLRPFQVFFTGVSDFTNSFYEAIYRYDALLAENNRLREELARVDEQSRAFEAAESENKRLREVLKLTEKRRDFTLVLSTIIARSPTNWASTLTLSKGSADGIVAGQAVMNELGYLVGVISEVGLNWSTVTTIVDTDTECGAYVYRTGQTALAEGDFTLMQENKLLFTYLTETSDIYNGDVLLTSGVGGTFPRDLEIGRIAEVRTDVSGITSLAVVEPSVVLERLTQVFVITAFDISE